MMKKLKVNLIDLSSLVYLIFPIIPLFTFDVRGSYWLYVLVFISFTLSYVSVAIFYAVLPKYLVFIFFILHYVGITYFVYSLGAAVSLFFFFSAFVIPYIFDKSIKSKEFIIFISAMLINVFLIFTLYFQSLGFILIMYLVIIIITLGNFKQRESIKIKNALEEKNRHINVLIAEQERNRIGQDLHDTLGHVFASLSLKSELAMKLIDSDVEKAKVQMLEVNTLSKNSLDKVRAIVNDLKVQSFEDEVSSVKSLLSNANLKFEFVNVEIASRINPSKQSILAMILREAINNILKHSNATSVHGELNEKENETILIIKDNGIGMHHIKDDDLLSIKERVALMNGTMKVKSQNGLQITIKISRGEGI
ncbi:sensor histidine kinase [Staphylococcus xylosus]|uniref:sensor histidine kinase n=1 Tax=Staphylococcus xylosus TaxID=1288 RepID=UPI002DBB062E|nr:sensor histidine kinase [Staphylococcus xylosus]MEB8121648.1 sensor histidine kinase [Staphylococcus xylosus]